MKPYSTRTQAGFDLHVAISDSKDTADIFLTPIQPGGNSQKLSSALDDARMQYDGLPSPEAENRHSLNGHAEAIRIAHITASDYPEMSRQVNEALQALNEKITIDNKRFGLDLASGIVSRSPMQQIDNFLANAFGVAHQQKRLPRVYGVTEVISKNGNGRG